MSSKTSRNSSDSDEDRRGKKHGSKKRDDSGDEEERRDAKKSSTKKKSSTVRGGSKRSSTSRKSDRDAESDSGEETITNGASKLRINDKPMGATSSSSSSSSAAPDSILKKVRSGTRKAIKGIGRAELLIQNAIDNLVKYQKQEDLQGGRLGIIEDILEDAKKLLTQNTDELEKTLKDKTEKVEAVTAQLAEAEVAKQQAEAAKQQAEMQGQVIADRMKQKPCSPSTTSCLLGKPSCESRGLACTPSCAKAQGDHHLTCRNRFGCYSADYSQVLVLAQQASSASSVPPAAM